MSGTILVAVATTGTTLSVAIEVGDGVPPGSTLLHGLGNLPCLKICQCLPELNVIDPLLIEMVLELLVLLLVHQLLTFTSGK
eukprot:5731215-Prorocentrum_lima.AAC.1